MKNELTAHTTRTCPLCGASFTEPPALSRTDNMTQICPDCGTREALEAMGVPEKEREEILRIIHGSRKA